jgi:hypothetical protein
MSINVCNDRSMASITSLPSGVTGSSLVLLETQTASSSATISFTSNIDSTYKEYIFKYTDIHPASDNVDFQFNMSTNTGSNYNVTKTTTGFQAYLNEGDSANGLAYESGRDLAQSTDFQGVLIGVGNEADQCCAGQLHLFNPSSTTFVKHFISRGNNYRADTESQQSYFAGYGNTTSAVDAIQFKMSSGNIDAGTIKMYGVV